MALSALVGLAALAIGAALVLGVILWMQHR